MKKTFVVGGNFLAYLKYLHGMVQYISYIKPTILLIEIT